MAKSRKSPRSTASPQTIIRGNIDRISDDGMLFGWCLDETAPEQRVHVTIFADGEELGQAIAAGFRQDLMDAGVGTGQHGFNFTLPISVLRQQRTCTISACHTESQVALGGALTWRAESGTMFDDRLAKIESDLQLLGDRMQVTTSNDAAIAMLFDAVGTFFARLGQDLRDGRPSVEGMGLAGRVDVVAANFADIILPIPAASRVAILLTASVAADVLHAHLSAISKAQICSEADVFLLDTESDVTSALLPAVVRNLRYLRLRQDAVVECDSLMRMLHHEIVLFVDGALEFTSDWLDDIVGALVDQDNAGMIGLSRNKAAAAANLSGDGKGQSLTASVREIDAGGFAIRRGALEEGGGFDVSYDDIGIAVVDLCFRLRSAGWATDAFRAPRGTRLPLPQRNAGSAAYRRSFALLEQRWPVLGQEDEPERWAGCILTDQSDVDLLVTAVDLLIRARRRPLILSAISRPDASMMESALLQSHVDTVWCGNLESVFNVLAQSFPTVELICAPTSEDVAALKTRFVDAGTKADIMAMIPMLRWLRESIGVEHGSDGEPSRAHS